MLGPLIPRADLKPGIVRCIGKARELLDDAHLLVNANRPYGAANLFVLATQEIGKAVLLREAFESGDAWPRIAEFRSHDVKVERATTVLGSTAMWLKDGAFQHGAFQPNAFDVGGSGRRADEARGALRQLRPHGLARSAAD